MQVKTTSSQKQNTKHIFKVMRKNQQHKDNFIQITIDFRLMTEQ